MYPMTAYAPHDILRRIDNALLAEYANTKNLFPDLDIVALKPTDVAPIYDAIKKLEKDQRETVERDLRNVATMAEKQRIQRLHEVFKHDDIALPEFQKKRDSYDTTMWALINHPALFSEILKYSFPFAQPRHWHKFSYQQGHSAATDKAARDRLSMAIKDYFQAYNGSSEHCMVIHNSFQDYDYFFAYPSDHPEHKPEWLDDGTFDHKLHKLAFTVIFVFQKNGTSIDLYVEEKKQVKCDLFALWAKEILGLKNVETKPKRSFDLTAFHTVQPDIVIPENSPVKSVAVHKLRFAPRHNPKTIYTIEADISTNRQAVYDELERKHLNISHIKTMGIEVYLHADEAGK